MLIQNCLGLQNIPRASDLNCGSDAATLLLKLVSLHKLSDQQAISLVRSASVSIENFWDEQDRHFYTQALEYDPSSSTRRNPKELAKDLMRRGLISAEDAIDVRHYSNKWKFDVRSFFLLGDVGSPSIPYQRRLSR